MSGILTEQERYEALTRQPAQRKTDPTNPPHYSSGTPPPVFRENLQLIEILERAEVNYNEAMVMKYVYRHRSKDGLSDLDKAQWHLNRLREQYLASHPEEKFK